MNQKDEIYKIGEEITKCEWQCDGMCKDKAKGILPRGLYLEKRHGNKPIIILGLNPGMADEKEKAYFKELGDDYSYKEKYFFDNYLNIPFYKRSREFADAIGYDGDILWTELVKCESINKHEIPMIAMRNCINRFLIREIELMPDAPIIALGNEAFQFCSLAIPKRFIIGVPHPTGAFGAQLPRLTKQILSNRDHYLKLISESRDTHGNAKAIKLNIIS